MANRLAGLLVCDAGSGAGLFGPSTSSKRPCAACASCQSFSRGIHQDVLVLERPEDEHVISIDLLRPFLSRLGQSPALASRKVAIIDEAESMSPGASNAFLKHLEEPTDSTTIILVVQDFQRLLPTIVSRCQLIEFAPVVSAPAETRQDPLWQQSRGLPGLYRQYQQAPSLAQQAKDELDQFALLLDMTAGQRFAFIDSFFSKKKAAHASQKQDWDRRFASWQMSIRQALLGSLTGQNLNNKGLEPRMYIRLHDDLTGLRQGLRHNINIRAHLERFLLDLNA